MFHQLNKAISKTMYEPGKQNSVCANDEIKLPKPQSWKTDVSYMFIEVPTHLLFLGIVKSIMEVVDKYIKQYRLGNKLISHVKAYTAQIESFHLEFLQIQHFPNTSNLSEWCLGMAHVFPFIYGKVTTTIKPTIHYGNK